MVQAGVAAQLFLPDFLHMSGTIVSPSAGYAANWPAFAMNMGISFHNVKQSVWKFVLYSGSCKCHDYDMDCSRRQRNACIV
jgi:biotin transporter BioY